MVAYPGAVLQCKTKDTERANNGLVHSNAYTLVTELPFLYL